MLIAVSFSFLVWWLTVISSYAAVSNDPHSGMAVFVAGNTVSFMEWVWSPPSLEPLWQIIMDAQEKGMAWADYTLKEAKEAYGDIGGKLESFPIKIQAMVAHSRELRDELESKIDLEILTQQLTLEANNIIDNLQKEFEKPLPEDMDERALYRSQMTNGALDQLQGAFVKICVELSLSEVEALDHFQRIRLVIEEFLLVAGNIVDKHPDLVKTVVITAVCLMIPETLILRPILSLFGFGPTGPVKGSIAAFLQRRFWGGAVEKGSWFAYFQKAGMIPGFWSKLGALFWGLMKALGLA